MPHIQQRKEKGAISQEEVQKVMSNLFSLVEKYISRHGGHPTHFVLRYRLHLYVYQISKDSSMFYLITCTSLPVLIVSMLVKAKMRQKFLPVSL
jgi:hypothetical protein